MMLISILIVVLLLHLVLYRMFPKYPKIKTADHFDLILLLGCPCLDDGSLSSVQSKRVQAAIYYYEHGYCDTILVSGGCVKNEYNEAERIGNELHTKLPNATILLETKARNTFENLKFCKALYPDKNILLISSPSHLRRAYFFAKKFYPSIAMGCDNSRDPWFYYLWEYTRLWVALYWEIRLSFRNKFKKQGS